MSRKFSKVQEPRNPLLRGHVTRVGFDLSLGKTHIAALVHLEQQLEAGHWQHTESGRNILSNWITAIHGLQDRGLVVHHYQGGEQERKLPNAQKVPSRYYEITMAGRLVLGLLQEAGLYEEYAAALPIRREKTA